MRLKGLSTKNKEDAEAFGERFTKIINFPISKTWTINKEKEEGQYGIELREVSNLAICMGKAKKVKKELKNKVGEVIRIYEEFERVETKPCKYRNWDKLITKYCYKCKKTFNQNVNSCPTCIYSKGKNKGEQVNLRNRKSKVDFCQLNRTSYKKEEKHGK